MHDSQWFNIHKIPAILMFSGMGGWLGVISWVEKSNLKLLAHFTYLSTWFGMVWCLLNIEESAIAGQWNFNQGPCIWEAISNEQAVSFGELSNPHFLPCLIILCTFLANIIFLTFIWDYNTITHFFLPFPFSKPFYTALLLSFKFMASFFLKKI